MTSSPSSPTAEDLARVERLVGALGSPERSNIETMSAVADALTRRWLPNPGPQRDAYHSLADELFYGGQAGGGKLLDLDEILPTPEGWKTVADVAVGDRLFDEKGQVCTVLAVSAIEENPRSYRLSFDDGSTLDACADHRWLTFDARDLAALTTRTPAWRAARRSQRKSRALGKKSERFRQSIAARNAANPPPTKPAPAGAVRTTQVIFETLRKRSGRANHAIPVAEALDLPEIDLPVDPYVLGAWLGDGTSRGAGLTGADPEIWQQIEIAGHEVRHSKRDAHHHYIRDLIGKLRQLDLLRNKHVPGQYLRAATKQRLALLQGLMDTDGHAATDGGSEFDNTNRNLIDAVFELAVSLGIKATMTEGRAILNGKDCGPKWRVKMTTTLPIFRLSRKLARLPATVRRTQRFRYITACEPIDPKPMRCIAVSSPSRLYLAGRSMIPTHNSDLLEGLALNEHENALLLRRTNKEASKFIKRFSEIVGDRKGWNGQRATFTLPPAPGSESGRSRVIEFGGCQLEDDKQKFKGDPHDLICFDEIADFTESQYRFIIGWNRSARKGQRCRVVAAGNPPTRPEGLWVLKYWGAWLDPTHPRPARPGELRWYTTIGGEDREVDGPGPHPVGGEMVLARSRTFIPAELSDNPDLAETGYASVLAALPAELRSAYKEGRFDRALKDHEFQTIPTAWILAAEERWRPDGYRDLAMTAIGLDPAGGGRDSAELACRYGGWYAALVSAKGAETADGSAMAGLVVRHRRDGAPVVVDAGGGYAGAVITRFQDNGIAYLKFDGAARTAATARGSGLKFANRRAEAWWRFREALDPDQEGGSAVALPPDTELRADLATPRWSIGPRGIQIESKDEIRARLGRSPGKGDAAVMALSEGDRAARQRATFAGRIPRVLLGYQHAKQRR